jgi:AcrR family transcriptional regulator
MTQLTDDSSDRYPSGRRKQPLGVRTGGAAWNQVHQELAVVALHFLTERGYGGMAMDDVAEGAGVAKRTIYRHYPAKIELGVAAVRQMPTYGHFEPAEGPMEQQLRDYIGWTYAIDASLPLVLATAIAHSGSDPQLLAAVKEHVLIPREAAFAAHLKRGQDTGEIKADIKPAAISALSTGMQFDHFTGLHPWSSDESGTDYAMSIIWPMLRP